MTPETFAATYGPLARRVAAATTLTPRVILGQWAVETGWGESGLAVGCHNLAGIRWYGQAGTHQIGGTRGQHGTGFACYPTLSAFAADYTRIMGLPYYAKVRAAVGVHAQALALGQSPWDAGHYTANGTRGGSLLAAIGRLPVPPVGLPSPHPARVHVVESGESLWTIAEHVYGAGKGRLWPRIAAANDIERPYIIHAGERLIIP